jgi:deoxyribonuclease V
MSAAALHPWNLEPEAAIRLQSELRQRLVLAWDGRPVSTVAGVDISLPGDLARAAIVVLTFPDLEPLEAATAEVPLSFPYVPGLLSFREGPAILAAWAKLTRLPDLILFDGQGIAHPRGIGIASQMGLWLERPTIGVAKSRLYGRHEPPGPERGDQAPLLSQSKPERIIGAVLRTRPGTNPLYVSPGHLIDVPRAVEFTLACVTHFRLPEPTRWAHKVAGGEQLPPAPAEAPRLF